MEGLSSASAAFAVISLAVHLAESVNKLVEFWQAIEDAPADICDLFNDLKLLSAALIQNGKKFAQHSPYDPIAERTLSKCQKRVHDGRIYLIFVSQKEVRCSEIYFEK
ncbi:uncharacterized protein EAF01_006773 [Botrytis porri]|uniref:uncharacterized protein n=1 Tax=Botrytis porri TaxID=87229 RepID=UPI0019001C4D|nr:uncharacterized protein EAF01_006773 [Botrytis porri]KAF7903724.1 hypothetical protein EAF01_006773 [Botrytis porri]